MPTFDFSFTFSVVFLFYLNNCKETFPKNPPHTKKKHYSKPWVLKEKKEYLSAYAHPEFLALSASFIIALSNCPLAQRW